METPAPVETRRAIPLVFVAEDKTKQIEQWRVWLRRNGLPSAEALSLRITKGGKPGYALPGFWPPDEASARSLEWMAFFSHRCDYVAKRSSLEQDIRKAS